MPTAHPYDEFCPECEKFTCSGSAASPFCENCETKWVTISDYWNELDTWEARRKMKISDFRAMAADPTGYVAHQLEKDLAVLVANTRLDMSNQMAKKILDIMESTGKTDPAGTLNKIAITLGSFVGDGIRDLDKAEKEAKEA